MIGYGGAWFGHFVLEGNTPATFGHPLWSLRGDWEMIGMMLTGRDGELGRIAADYLAREDVATEGPADLPRPEDPAPDATAARVTA